MAQGAEKLFDNDLISRLPQARGLLEENAPLAPHTWFRVGGPAEVFFHPQDADDLSYFLSHTPADIPVTILGAASNVLIRDGGIPGVVIRLGPAFGQVRVEGDALRAGGAAVKLNVARSAQGAGIAGMEFFCGIPGTIGGGLRMNAGSYGNEFKDIVIAADVMDRSGVLRTLASHQIGFSYRHAGIPEDSIFLSTLLQGETDKPAEIAKRMDDIQKKRRASQPVGEQTCGSTFANPDNDPRPSWKLIEDAGCRGLRHGQAKVSEKHCNFLINTGHATAADIESLGEEVRRRVRDKFGIELRWEIKRLGVEREQD